MIVCAPIANAFVVHVAVPLLSGRASHPAMSVPPSLNATLPSGVPVAEATVAVNVTDCVNCAGSRSEATEVVVGCGAFTVCVRTLDVLARNVAVPPKVAVIEWLPGASDAVANVA